MSSTTVSLFGSASKVHRLDMSLWRLGLLCVMNRQNENARARKRLHQYPIFTRTFRERSVSVTVTPEPICFRSFVRPPVLLSTCLIRRGSYTESPELLKELVKQVATHIGPFARPGMIVGTPGLPKTRSGKKPCLVVLHTWYDTTNGPAILIKFRRVTFVRSVS